MKKLSCLNNWWRKKKGAVVKRKFVFRSLHVLAKTLNKHVSQTVSGHHRTAMRYVTTIRIQRISGIHLFIYDSGSHNAEILMLTSRKNIFFNFVIARHHQPRLIYINIWKGLYPYNFLNSFWWYPSIPVLW